MGQLSDDQIITYMTDRYGAQLLLVPKATGFDALVWALPVAAAAVCAIVGLAFAFHRWRRAVDTVPDDDEAPSSPVRASPEPGTASSPCRAPTGWIPVRARHQRPTSASPTSPTSPSSSPSSSRSSSSPTTRGTRPMSPATDPDRLAQLEEERRFLLRSIDDLEREHDAGDVDDHDFLCCTTATWLAVASACCAKIDEGRSALPVRRRRPGVVLAVVVATIAFAVFAGWLVARSSGQREEDGTAALAPADEVSQQLSVARAAAATFPARRSRRTSRSCSSIRRTSRRTPTPAG